jgi:hypothetical protein
MELHKGTFGHFCRNLSPSSIRHPCTWRKSVMSSVRRRRTLVLLCLAGCLLAGLPASAAEPGSGWHIVRPGETLHRVAARYLGSAARWPEIARLNPGIEDPNRVEPGQRIRVPRAVETPAARVARLSRKVEAQPTPIAWENARQDDLLLEKDGLRTYGKSSAEMAFSDGTRLLVTESSLVFLQQTGGQLRGLDRKAVEIVEGQAEVESGARSAGGAVPEVEIVLGSTRARSRPAPSGMARTRARRAEEGGAKLMVYGGEGEVEAGGAKVSVPEGMGTSVASQGPPSPPEKLLAAPQGLLPAAGREIPCANPRLAWQPVPDAISYTVEVCRDTACGALVDRAVGVEGTEWRPAALPKEDLHWRVTARSRSGLDGYPSEPVRLTVTSDRTDTQGPTGRMVLVGPQVQVGEVLYAGPMARVQVETEDAESGIDAEAAGQAYDLCGNAGTIQPVAFTLDSEVPELTWEVVDLADFQGRKRSARATQGFAWSGGTKWLHLRANAEEVRIQSLAPQLLLRGSEARLLIGKDLVEPLAGQMLRIRAKDAGAGVDQMTFQLRDTENGGRVLEINVVDLVGNARKVEWEVGR